MRSSQIVSNCAVLTLLVAVPVLAKRKIATVPAEYTPPISAFSEHIKVENYHFEVNHDATRERLVVEYGYPDELYDISIGDGGGPPATRVQVPGLRWDPEERAVVYRAGDKETRCAVALGTPGKHLRLRNTGACAVTTSAAVLKIDDGWDAHSLKNLDLWFEAK